MILASNVIDNLDFTESVSPFTVPITLILIADDVHEVSEGKLYSLNADVEKMIRRHLGKGFTLRNSVNSDIDDDFSNYENDYMVGQLASYTFELDGKPCFVTVVAPAFKLFISNESLYNNIEILYTEFKTELGHTVPKSNEIDALCKGKPKTKQAKWFRNIWEQHAKDSYIPMSNVLADKDNVTKFIKALNNFTKVINASS